MILIKCLDNNLNICYFVEKTRYNYESKLFDLDNQIEIGSFEINGEFDSGKTVDMGIRVEKEYQGKGYSKELIKVLCNYILQTGYPKIRKDQMLFIDTDASAGFWDKIGMKSHRYGDDYIGRRNVEGVGYEKMITFGDLCKWSGVSLPIGGNKEKKTQNKATIKKKKHKTNKQRNKKNKKHKTIKQKNKKNLKKIKKGLNKI